MRLKLLGLLMLAIAGTANAFTLSPGHFYAAGSPWENLIHEYDAQGRWVSSLAIPSARVRGIAIGPDGNLYAVVDPEPNGSTPRVDVIDSNGQIIRNYPFTGSIWGHIALGKIVFSRDGTAFYVGTGTGIYRFIVGGISGSPMTSGYIYDVEVLPSGQLLVAEDGRISIRTAAGALVSEFHQIIDPQRVSGAATFDLEQVDAVAYSEKENRTYVTMLSNGRSPKIFTLEGLGNTLMEFEHFPYAMDIWITEYGRILVGGAYIAPGIFGSRLEYLGQFEGSEAAFVTSYPERIFTHGFE